MIVLFPNTIDKLNTMVSNHLGDSNIEVPKDKVIYEAGDIPLGLFYIKKGQVKIIRTTASGEEFFKVESKGAFLGLEEVTKNSNYSYLAIAETDTELLFLSKREVKEALL